MGKYSRDELRQAARIVLADKRAGGDRWFQLLMAVANRTRLNAQHVWAQIQKLAE